MDACWVWGEDLRWSGLDTIYSFSFLDFGSGSFFGCEMLCLLCYGLMLHDIFGLISHSFEGFSRLDSCTKGRVY